MGWLLEVGGKLIHTLLPVAIAYLLMGPLELKVKRIIDGGKYGENEGDSDPQKLYLQETQEPWRVWGKISG